MLRDFNLICVKRFQPHKSSLPQPPQLLLVTTVSLPVDVNTACKAPGQRDANGRSGKSTDRQEWRRRERLKAEFRQRERERGGGGGERERKKEIKRERQRKIHRNREQV